MFEIHTTDADLAQVAFDEAQPHKKLRGQFFTKGNPFGNALFARWLEAVPARVRASTWLEPFAGANHIVRLVGDAVPESNRSWACYDIQPSPDNVAPWCPVVRRDTLAAFPQGFDLAVTNPPYLARNSATRSGLPFPACGFDDLYKFALSVALDRVGYLAAIIPESFLTAGLFHDRLYGVATLNFPMFDDTDCPVCLAMFVPASVKDGSRDFVYYKGDLNLGPFSALCQRKAALLAAERAYNWRFNAPEGSIGLHAVDNQKARSIRFVPGSTIDAARVKSTGRSITRIAGLPRGVSASVLIETANALLEELRNSTADVFLTAFKGLRTDGDYRRRLDFALARAVLNASVGRIRGGCAIPN